MANPRSLEQVLIRHNGTKTLKLYITILLLMSNLKPLPYLKITFSFRLPLEALYCFVFVFHFVIINSLAEIKVFFCKV